MSTKKIKVVSSVGTESLAQQGKPIALKGTLYILPNGDEFFECSTNHPKNITQKNGYKLLFSNGVTKHYVTKRRHVFFTSFSIDMTDLIGAVLPREITRFCAEACQKGTKYYVNDDQT